MRTKRVIEFLETLYQREDVPGNGIRVYHKGNLVFEYYTGFQNVAEGIPFSADTVFHIYSATKISTCVAIMQYVEQGILRLSDPIFEYIPEYKNLMVGKENPDGTEEVHPVKTPLTIEHLLSMTSGVRAWTKEGKGLLDVFLEEGKTPYTLDMVKAVADIPLGFEPGTQFQYGYSHDVLGGLLEVLSGKTLGEHLAECIFDPLGMKHTAFQVKPGDERHKAVCYHDFDGKTGTSKGVGTILQIGAYKEYERGGGGLVSTVPDYGTLVQTLCNGGISPEGHQLLKPETLEDMATNRLGKSQMEDFHQWSGWVRQGYGYGLGVRTMMLPKRNNSLSEIGEFGWDGACGCYVLVDPKLEVAIFYAQEEYGNPWWEWHGMLRNLVYAGLQK